MFKKVVLGLAALVVVAAVGTAARADSWQHGSGYGKGSHGQAWSGHGGSPHWAEGRGRWDGYHGQGHGHYGGNYDRFRGVRPYSYNYSPQYVAPGGCVQGPYGRGWSLEFRVYPRSGWQW